MQQNLPFRVIDKRSTSFYWADKEFLNGYAKKVGWQGQVVYMALCRHEQNGTCFPSLKHLAVELGISIPSVQRGIKKLKEYNIIQIVRRGKTQSNIYYLLGKENWKAVSNWSNQGKEYKPFKGLKVKAK